MAILPTIPCETPWLHETDDKEDKATEVKGGGHRVAVAPMFWHPYDYYRSVLCLALSYRVGLRMCQCSVPMFWHPYDYYRYAAACHVRMRLAMFACAYILVSIRQHTVHILVVYKLVWDATGVGYPTRAAHRIDAYGTAQ